MMRGCYFEVGDPSGAYFGEDGGGRGQEKGAQ